MEPVEPSTVTLRASDRIQSGISSNRRVAAIGVHACAPNRGLRCSHEHQQRQHRRRGQSGIHAVEHAAMAGNERAGILAAEAALDAGFKQIAAMGRETEDTAPKAAPPAGIGMPDNADIEPHRSAPRSTLPPMVPAQVLPGDRRGAMRGPPIRLPQIKAPVSVAQTIRNRPITIQRPMRRERAQRHQRQRGQRQI